MITIHTHTTGQYTIHKSFNEEGYTITHIKSGFAIFDEIPDLHAAINALRALQQIDLNPLWRNYIRNRSSPAITKAVHQIQEIYHTIIEPLEASPC